jgi:hypothetical protein
MTWRLDVALQEDFYLERTSMVLTFSSLQNGSEAVIAAAVANSGFSDGTVTPEGQYQGARPSAPALDLPDAAYVLDPSASTCSHIPGLAG